MMLIGILVLLSSVSTTHAAKYAPTIVPYVETENQKIRASEGAEAYDIGDYALAKQIMEPLAEEGHPEALTVLGLMHSKGFEFTINRKIACDYYEKAALVGHAPAQNNVSGLRVDLSAIGAVVVIADVGAGRKATYMYSVFIT